MNPHCYDWQLNPKTGNVKARVHNIFPNCFLQYCITTMYVGPVCGQNGTIWCQKCCSHLYENQTMGVKMSKQMYDQWYILLGLLLFMAGTLFKLLNIFTCLHGTKKYNCVCCLMGTKKSTKTLCAYGDRVREHWLKFTIPMYLVGCFTLGSEKITFVTSEIIFPACCRLHFKGY